MRDGDDAGKALLGWRLTPVASIVFLNHAMKRVEADVLQGQFIVSVDLHAADPALRDKAAKRRYLPGEEVL